jgi:AraC family transcriptional regulator
MEPQFENLKERKLIGKKLAMSLSNNKTPELWRSFMPVRKEIKNSVNSDLYSVEVYGPAYFSHFNPAAVFEKWAAAEVDDLTAIPEGMETLILPEGLYAVFLYKGPASAAPKLYQFIFENWLPNSDCLLDNRPHFALMGEKYKNEDPCSEEEIWIPVKHKNNGK